MYYKVETQDNWFHWAFQFVAIEQVSTGLEYVSHADSEPNSMKKNAKCHI